MTAYDPIELLFGGMDKLGPGSDADTLQVLRSLPQQRFDLVVDAGCGAGRQTLALASTLNVTIHAVDSHQPFLDELQRRAEANPEFSRYLGASGRRIRESCCATTRYL